MRYIITIPISLLQEKMWEICHEGCCDVLKFLIIVPFIKEPKILP